MSKKKDVKVSVSADRRFRRAQHSPARRRRLVAGQVRMALQIAAVLALALFGGWRTTALVLGAGVLEVSRISMRGNQRLSDGEVLALVEGLHGANIVTVDLNEWRERVLASPWVEDARVRRVLPSTIEIEIDERRPIGIARLGDRLYLVDRRGVAIDEFGPNYGDLNLPIVDGLRGAPGRRTGEIDPARAELAARVIDSLGQRPDLAARISQIDVSDPHNAVVVLEGETVLLRLGESDFAERLQGYLDLAPALRERMPQIDYVDLRFGDRLYVKPVE